MQRTSNPFVIPLWLAIGAGAVESTMAFVAKRVNPFRHVSEDVIWMAPLALVATCMLVVLPFALLYRVQPRRVWIALGLVLSSTIAIADILFLAPGLAPPAALILSLGIAVQLTRVALRRLELLSRLAFRSLLPLLAVALVAGAFFWNSLRPSLAAFAGPAAGARPPNLVFVTLDTVRAASLSVYGYPRQTSPVLEALARQATVFDAAFAAASWTLPSHASMFTGRWPHELSVDYATPLDGTVPTIAEFLTTRGYRTAGFAANFGYVSHESGLGRGFQHYEDYPRSLGQIVTSSRFLRTVADNFRVRRLLENDEHLNRMHAPDLSARALAWIDDHRDAPFMVFLNYFDAHEPYLPPPPFDRQFGPGRAHGRHSPLHHWLWNPAVDHGNMGEEERREEIDAYDGAIAALDQDFGAFLDALGQRGLTDDTVVIVTSDHGEELGEHGLYDHGYSLYRMSLHVPLLIRAPGRAPAGRRVATPVSLRELPATIVDLLGVGNPSVFPGASLASLWSTGGEARSPDVLFEVKPSPGQPDWFPSTKGTMVGVVLGDLHYIRNGDGREELYEWRTDVLEEKDLSGQPAYLDRLATARATAARLRGALPPDR